MKIERYYENYQNNILEEVEQYLEKLEMTKSERLFLNGIVGMKIVKQVI